MTPKLLEVAKQTHHVSIFERTHSASSDRDTSWSAWVLEGLRIRDSMFRKLLRQKRKSRKVKKLADS